MKPSDIPAKAIKAKKCRYSKCRQLFVPTRPLQTVCDWRCSLALTEEKKQKEIRREIRIRKERLKTTADHARDAQRAFNAFIVYRDRHLPCISCGRHHTGNYHAGHYRSVGAAPQLRFDESNVHKQCAPCNLYKSGNLIEYRIALIGRVGVEEVERLEAESRPVRLRAEQLNRIQDYYRAELKALKARDK